MKSVLLILTVSLSSFFCKAQFIEHWNRITEDSVAFAQVYGSVDEYNYQHMVRHSNRHNFRIHFINTKPYYITAVVEWLAQEGYCGNTFWEKEDPGIYYECGSDACPPPSEDNQKSPPFAIRAFVNKKNRIVSVKISGDMNVLVKLFLYYWEGTNIKGGQIRKGKEIYQDSMDDRITFSWHGDKPVIIIKKNPNLTYFERKFSIE